MTMGHRASIDEVAEDMDAAFGSPARAGGDETKWWERWPGC